MISSEATIPARVLVRNDMSMIKNSTPKNSFVANNWIEEVLNYYRESYEHELHQHPESEIGYQSPLSS